MASAPATNLDVYSAPEVVKFYAELNSVNACEQKMFQTHLKRGTAILDLGVGGGRTTPYLSSVASHYVGADYSEEMVRVCRKKFPQLRFEVADAADLSRFADQSFDAAVFSYNGSDYIAPEEKRSRFLRECHRVLKSGGVFIFSSHNPRAIFAGLVWDRERLRSIAGRLTRRAPFLFPPALALLTSVRVGFAFLQSLRASLPRVLRRVPTEMFWRGNGYWMDPTHGGLLTYCSVPGRTMSELASSGFRLLECLPEDYPTKSRLYTTRWFYYAAVKA